MAPLTALVEAARAPLARWPARYPGFRAVGILCSYVPAEMVHAAGFTPVRLRGTAAPLRQVDAHLQSFACALCRSTLDQRLSEDLDFLAGTLFAHTCDAMQAQADLWRINSAAGHFVDTVMQPANLGSPAARGYLVAELGRFRESLASAGGAGEAISDAALRDSIALYDETRRLVQVLDGQRDRLSAAELYAVLDAAQVMPRELYNPLLTELLRKLEPASRRSPGPRLFLTGAVLDEPRLLDLIDALGAQVTGDDLCSGLRHFGEPVGVDGDPIERLAEHSLRRPPCPSKHLPGHDPGPHLLELAATAGSDGIVFVVEKFCEPYAFAYALARPALERAGVPYLVLEMEQTPSLEALRTRLQAFLEML